MKSRMTPDSYQAEDDSRTLARAEEIKMDKPRHKAAKKKSMQTAKAHARVAECDMPSMEKGYK